MTQVSLLDRLLGRKGTYWEEESLRVFRFYSRIKLTNRVKTSNVYRNLKFRQFTKPTAIYALILSKKVRNQEKI